MRTLPLAVLASCLAVAEARSQEKDTSGTNPVVLSKTASISNEYRFLPIGDSYYDVTNLRYTQPSADGTTSVRFTVPLNRTDITGEEEFGFGDVSAKFSWVAHVDRRQGIVLTTEIYAPTASEDILGSGYWIVAPGITWANFISPSIIIAPAYVHNISFAGDEARADVQRGDFDLYVVYKPRGENWWITSDLTASYDFVTDRTPATWEVNFGRTLFQLDGGGAVNGYVRPGIGLGSDRPYDYNIEFGINVVNF